MTRDRIKDLRTGKRSGISRTQEEMSRLMKVSKDAYIKWEQRGDMPAEYIELFCSLTQCSLDYFFTGKD